MFLHLMKTALRHLSKNGFYTAINMAGLAFGFAAVMTIALFVQYERSYNAYFKEADRLNQLFITGETETFTGASATMSARFMPVFLEAFPEFETGARRRAFNRIVAAGNNRQNRVVTHVDPAFAEMFSLEYIAGGGPDALANPGDLLISEDIALAYFARTDVVGETLTIDNVRSHRITGVYRTLPGNTILAETDIIIPIDVEDLSDWPGLINNWGSFIWWTFVKLKPGLTLDDITDFDARMVRLMDEHVPNFDPNYQQMSEYARFQPVPLLEERFFNPFPDAAPNRALTAVRNFSAIALAILLIAGINFVNMSVAQSTRRTLDVAMRKTLGAGRRHIIAQYLCESILLSTAACLFGLAIVEVSLPAFNQLMDLDLSIETVLTPSFIVLLAGFVLFVGVLGGTYPALVVSGYRPGNVLKSNRSKIQAPTWIREGLVVLQYTASIALIIFATIIYSQTDFVLRSNEGFVESGQIVLSGVEQDGVLDRSDLLTRRLADIPGVTAAARSLNVPGEGVINTTTIAYDRAGRQGSFTARNFTADPTFLDAYDIPLLAGRRLDRNRQSDDNQEAVDGIFPLQNALVDMTFVERLGFNQPEAALGYQVNLGDGTAPAEIVGVIGAINFASARSEREPLLFSYDSEFAQRITVKFNQTNLLSVRREVERVWNETVPEIPIELSFLDDRLAENYATDVRQAHLILLFSALATIIASLGLYALAGIDIANRTKEIGIRKVMGAGALDIAGLMIRQFSRPVVIAALLAVPLGWYLADQYLDGFIRRIDIPVTPFIVAALIAFAISWSTIMGHLNQVIRTHPIKALRYE